MPTDALPTSENGPEELEGNIQDPVESYLSSFPSFSFDSYKASRFHQINVNFPDLQLVREEPFIFLVPRFLPPEMCDKLVEDASPYMQPATILQMDAGQAEYRRQSDEWHLTYFPDGLEHRTNEHCSLWTANYPDVLARLQDLLQLPAGKLVTSADYPGHPKLDVLHYTAGQHFTPHNDSHEDMPPDQRRIVTLFVYLNDCDEGGETVFCGEQCKVDGRDKFKLDPEVFVKPHKGLGVIHFPEDLDHKVDRRSNHAGLPAVSEKFLMVQWGVAGA